MSATIPLNPIGTGQGVAATDQSGQSWLGGSWWQQLQPASWRGVGFILDNAPTKGGRRIALHEYPYKDNIWPEDLGKLPRRFQVSGFLVGDDCYQQKLAMIQACEQQGAGTLVHPTLGSVQVYLLDFTTTDRRDRGRYVEVDFQFIDGSAASMAPALTANTGDIVSALAGQLNSASAGSLAQSLGSLSPVTTNNTVPAGFAQQAINLVNDPARALSAVSGLPGLYGRYANGNNSMLQPAGSTVAGALAQSTTSRQAVIDAAGSLMAAAEAL